MTVKDLMNECKRIVADGHGDKEVWISRDDEGNGYHSLYYTFQTDAKVIKDIEDMGMLDYGAPNVNKIVLLG